MTNSTAVEQFLNMFHRIAPVILVPYLVVAPLLAIGSFNVVNAAIRWLGISLPPGTHAAIWSIHFYGTIIAGVATLVCWLIIDLQQSRRHRRQHDT